MEARAEVVFFFIDKDEARITHLEEVAIPRLGQLPANVKVHYLCSSFDESVMAMLDALEERGGRLALASPSPIRSASPTRPWR
jgi:hypothetical protein